MGVRRDMSRSHRRIRQIKKTGRAFNPAGWYSTLEASRLEDQLQAVLEFTIVVVNDSRCFHVVSGQSGRDQVVRRTAWLVQARCVCRTTVHCADRISRVVRLEIRVVEEVEGIHTELQVESLGQLPVLLNGEIVIHKSRPSAEARRLIAE